MGFYENVMKIMVDKLDHTIDYHKKKSSPTWNKILEWIVY